MEHFHVTPTEVKQYGDNHVDLSLSGFSQDNVMEAIVQKIYY